jgi:NAD(P)-dependent dehydrogenase (short-subunit alcohol dehydrogenase family)
MAYFVLTAGLRERLAAAPAARIINTASSAHTAAVLDFDDLQSEKGYGAIKAYGRSKLCNILFTRELARRLHGTAVTANCLHPGFVATRFADESGGLLSYLTRVAKLFAISPARGADTIIYLASAPDVAQTTGQYFYRRRPAKTRRRRRMTARLPPCGNGARPWPASRTDGVQARAPLAAAQSVEIEAFVDRIICAVSCAASRSVIDPSRTV